MPSEPVNTYRSGEKIVLDKLAPDDFGAEVTIDFAGNKKGRGAGLLFRTTGASVGYDAHRGYFVGVKPSEDAVLLGKMDGSGWQELKRVKHRIDTQKKQRLRVVAIGKNFTVSLNGETVLTHSDATYKRGTIGLRVVDIPATFSDLVIHPAPNSGR